MSDPMPDKANQETARIVLALDTAITAFRAGETTGLRALDATSRLMGDLADDVVVRETVIDTMKDYPSQ